MTSCFRVFRVYVGGMVKFFLELYIVLGDLSISVIGERLSVFFILVVQESTAGTTWDLTLEIYTFHYMFSIVM